MATTTALRSAANALTTAQERIRAVRDGFVASDADLLNNPQLSDAYRRQLRDELRSQARGKLDVLQAEFRDLGTVLGAPAPPDTRPAVDQLLDEQRQAKAWERAARMLAAGSAPADLAKEAETTADINTLRALRSELPSWVAASVHGGATHEERAAAAVTITRMVDLSLARVLPDNEERAALRCRLLWDAYAPIVESELHHAWRLLDGLPHDGLAGAIAQRYMRTAVDELDGIAV